MTARKRFARDVIHEGDCCDMRQLPDGAMDLVVAGPPYWRLIDYGQFAREGIRREATGPGYEAFLEELRRQFEEVHRVLRPGRFCAVNLATVQLDGRTYPLPFHAVSVLEQAGLTFCFEIVWHKPAGGRRSARGFLARPFAGSFRPNNVVEYVLVFRKAPDRAFASRAQRVQSLENALVVDDVFRREIANNVWHFMPAAGKGEHPCPFPPALPLRLIALLSLKGETVLDPFMGSGTTARAARALGRRFVGYEREPRFAELARREAAKPLRIDRALLLALQTVPARNLA